MALTANTLLLQRNRVRLLIQEPTAQYWSDSDLNSYINEAQFGIACGVIPGTPVGSEEPLLPSEAYTTPVASQELYSLPPNYHSIRVVRARSTSTEAFKEMPEVDIEYVRAHPRDAAAISEAYFLWGEEATYQIGMYPAFNATTGRIYVSYWRKPTELTSDSDVLQIPAELHRANALLSTHYAWFDRGHQEEAQNALQLFNIAYQGALPFVRRRNINSKRAIMLGVIGDTDTERTIY